MRQRPVRVVPIQIKRGGAQQVTRGALIAVAVVVILIAIIALANRDRGGGAAEPFPAGPPGFTHDKQGSEAAAVRYAAALGGERMFNPESRHALIQQLAAPGRIPHIEDDLDDYTPDLNRKLGLDENGQPPAGKRFLSRTMPAGVTVTDYTTNRASLHVWCSGLLGVPGSGRLHTQTSWFTIRLTLAWTAGTWRLWDLQEQVEGPEPGDADDFGQAPPL